MELTKSMYQVLNILILFDDGLSDIGVFGLVVMFGFLYDFLTFDDGCRFLGVFRH